ncbi:Hypothetical predicted protein, partial [Mytilus galloprovincialis]
DECRKEAACSREVPDAKANIRIGFWNTVIDEAPKLRAKVRLEQRYDLLVVIGDQNAKGRNRNTDVNRIIGEH